MIGKKKTAVHEDSFANPFSDFPIERYKRNPLNPDLDFAIEICPPEVKSIFGFRVRLQYPKSDLDFKI